MKSEKFYLDFILDCIRKIENSTSGINKETFLENQEKQSAVILQLMLIGETSKKLSEGIKNKIHLPWKEIAGFRDMAIHDYVNLNLDTVWNTAVDRIPELKQNLYGFQNEI